MGKKLQDYIHCYIGCKCANTWFPEGHENYLNGWRLTGYLSTSIKPFELENDEDNTYTDSIKPILRKLDSMSLDEWAEVKEQLSADLVMNAESVRYKDKPYWVLVLENRVNTNTLRLNDGLVLIRLGYDVFNLIESDLAIDASTLTK